MPATHSTLKRPASSSASGKGSKSLKRPAASINETIDQLRKGTPKTRSAHHDDDHGEDEQEEDDDDDKRDKSKGQKYAKMRDQLPAYVHDLIEVESKKHSSPRDWKTKCINKLFVKDSAGKLVLNLNDSLFEEHRKIYSTKYAKEEDHAMPESIILGLYFHNDEKAFERAKKLGDVEPVECSGKTLWKYTSYKKGQKSGTMETQTLSGKRTVEKNQEKILKQAFDEVGWDWTYSTSQKNIKVFEDGAKIPKQILNLVNQAMDSQTKLMREAMGIIKSWPNGKTDDALAKLKRGHSTCSANCSKLQHMKDFQELPDGLEPTQKNLDGLMMSMAEHVQSYNELIETSRGVLRASKN